MDRRTGALLALVVAVAGCGNPAAPTPTVVPSADAATPRPSVSATDSPALRGQLAFAAGADPQIFLLDLATGEQRQLTSLRPEDGTPATAAGPMRPALSCAFGPYALAWSPDGSLLAFHYGACDGVIWTVDLDGNATRIADGTGPSWTPDGLSIVFSPNRPWDPCGFGCQGEPPAPGAWDLQVVEIAGDDPPRPLTEDGATVAGHGATWSPDGSLLAFAGPAPRDGADGETFSAAYVLAEDGSGRRLVARGGWPLGWLPDGRLLVVDERTGRTRAVDLVTNAEEAIGGADRVVAVWPDGRLLSANVSDPATGVEHGRIVGADGAVIAELEGPAGAFSPDGRWLLSMDAEGTSILVHDRTGAIVASHEAPFGTWIGEIRWRP